MAHKWTPPPGYAEFVFNGKSYKPGDMVPISKALALHHMENSAHVFEGIDAPEPPTPSGMPAPEPMAPKAST